MANARFLIAADINDTEREDVSKALFLMADMMRAGVPQGSVNLSRQANGEESFFAGAWDLDAPIDGPPTFTMRPIL